MGEKKYYAYSDGKSKKEVTTKEDLEKEMLELKNEISELNTYLSELQSKHEKTKITAKDLAINGAWSTMFFDAYKRGSTVKINMEIFCKSIVANHTYNNVFTIPTKYRPNNRFALNAVATDGAYGNAVACMCMVDTSGNLILTIPKSTNNYVFISGEWECNA